MNRWILRAGISLVLALAAGAATPAAQAQRDRDWRYRDDSYSHNDRYSRDSLRRLVDRAESDSNSFRDVFERLEREWSSHNNDRYDRDNRYDRDYRYDRGNRDYRYDRDYRNGSDYRNDRGYGYDRRDDRYGYGSGLSALKQVVQRMDEGLERLRSDSGDPRNGNTRSRVNEIMSDARIIDRSLGRSRGSSELSGLWSRVRSDLNAMASAYGAGRI